jgi:pantetheine-phosphate adenylyltransferase
MKKSIIYPGTFDPITNGHIDLIERSLKLFDQVIIAIAESNKKSPLFNLEDRIEMVKKVFANDQRIIAQGFAELLVDFAEKSNVFTILRGLRAISDFEHEFQLAGMYKNLNPKIETIFLMPSQEYTYLSASMVREIASLKGDVSHFVPKNVATELAKIYR